MVIRCVSAVCVAAFSLTACQLGGGNDAGREVVAEVSGGVNPFLWRASLDALEDLPVLSADPVGGLIIYDWKSFPGAEDERIKATVYILDTRLRADGVKVAVFRQVRDNGEWIDATVDPATGIQLENRILDRARSLKAAQLG